MGHTLSADAEITRQQRRAPAPPLAPFAAMPERNDGNRASLRNGLLPQEGDCPGLGYLLRDRESGVKKRDGKV